MAAIAASWRAVEGQVPDPYVTWTRPSDGSFIEPGTSLAASWPTTAEVEPERVLDAARHRVLASRRPVQGTFARRLPIPARRHAQSTWQRDACGPRPGQLGGPELHPASD